MLLLDIFVIFKTQILMILILDEDSRNDLWEIIIQLPREKSNELENCFLQLKDITETMDKFIAFNREYFEENKFVVCITLECTIRGAFLIEGVCLYSYNPYSEVLLNGERHWLIQFARYAYYEDNFNNLVDKYSFSAGMDGTIYIKDFSDYQVMENWDGL